MNNPMNESFVESQAITARASLLYCLYLGHKPCAELATTPHTFRNVIQCIAKSTYAVIHFHSAIGLLTNLLRLGKFAQ